MNRIAGKVLFLQGKLKEAAACYEKSTELMDADYSGAGMLECCYRGLGDIEGRRRASARAFERVEKALAANPRDAPALANGALSLAILGRTDEAREWAERAIKLQPDNYMLRYNVACAYAMELDDPERALDLVEDSLRHLGVDHIRHAKADPDIASLRDHPRFSQMIAEAKARLKAEALPERANMDQEKMAPRA